ncbi:hypothetical protein GDO86_017497 [Hymenochirus boettgeri]|uniref:Uncharacterized protein n=1 Tax=Hymenochirus boettgeri TaxID=247094 RepID=A0A8T2INQ7_9PIPI|nr:hypothetical protein GDO86_017497 [Hymenochirus boettgeri]
MASADLLEELNCSICLNIYTDPVMLPCGHNYCQACIEKVLNTQKGFRGYNCPECREKFPKYPALQKNRKLKNIAERFPSVKLEPGVSGIFCTYCFHAQVPAIKTCLQCEISLCDVHLNIHNSSVEHVLTEPTTSIKNRKCSIHKELLKYFCHEDDVCLCASCCLAGEHKGHKVEYLNEAFDRKKQELKKLLELLTPRSEEIEERSQFLKDLRRQLQYNAANETERVNALFKDIKGQIEALEKKMLSEISKQEEQCSLPIMELIKEVEREKKELSIKILLIEDLCNMKDPLSGLQQWEVNGGALCCREMEEDKDCKRNDQKSPAGSTLDAGLISAMLLTGVTGIMTGVKQEICGLEATDMLLDTNTVANNVFVSGDLKTASWSEVNLHHIPKPERFQHCQVLSSGGFSSGKHYWEVETSKSGIWRVGMAYPSIEREGDQYCFGDDKKSWCLYMFDGDYSAIHNSLEQPISSHSPIQRIGIYLDYKAGRLSFYELCDPIRQLHTFHATFYEPLHAALRVYMNGWVRIRS